MNHLRFGALLLMRGRRFGFYLSHRVVLTVPKPGPIRAAALKDFQPAQVFACQGVAVPFFEALAAALASQQTYSSSFEMAKRLLGLPPDLVLNDFFLHLKNHYGAELEDFAVPAAAADEVLSFISCPGSSADKLAFLEKYKGKNEIFDAGLTELATVVNYMGAFGVPETNFEVDLTIARGLDYYTGTVYETILTDHPEIGSVCSGGRYDNLAEYYTDRTLPGVGISIGVTRLFYVLQEQKMLSEEILTAPADAVVIPMGADCMAFAVETATVLRAAGVRTQVYFEDRKFKQKIGFADKSGIPFALIIGSDEAAEGVAGVKDMTTGEQQKLAPAAAAEHILAALETRKRCRVIVD